ncbi:hypothetical protein DQ04_05701060 [Trypanosoma grayi]|uniref:hypothetical protein n=1 Tax=Trypanosoma grayi TaxID=71804 RepID=UPI0004F48BF8|nr:hypothetical protein DQ04_05701060 [Trypanosoma grayi]KEG09163.1 hypothetical protein DQ04_05701060 [Trypanosoma grayi]
MSATEVLRLPTCGIDAFLNGCLLPPQVILVLPDVVILLHEAAQLLEVVVAHTVGPLLLGTELHRLLLSLQNFLPHLTVPLIECLRCVHCVIVRLLRVVQLPLRRLNLLCQCLPLVLVFLQLCSE